MYTMKDYTFKQTSDDIAELARQLKCPRIILGGHDWYADSAILKPLQSQCGRYFLLEGSSLILIDRGGLIVQRCAQYHPSLVSHIFTLSTPYFPILPTFEPLSLLVKRFPNWNYMVQFASGELEPAIQSKTEIRNFLNSCLGFPSGPNGEVAFTPTGGAVVENFPKTQPTTLFTAREMEFYASEFARHGIRGPFTWYRTREHNFADEYEYFLAPRGTEKQLREDPGIQQDVLHILTRRDRVFDAETCRTTEPGFKKLIKKEIDADHWALWEKPQEINDILTEWLREVVLREEKAG